jgi:phage shock protein E
MSGKKKGLLADNLPMVVVLVVVVVLGALIFLSMGLEPDGQGTVIAIGNDELRGLVDDGALLVDVRTPSEYDAGHIPGAILAPVDSIASDADDWDRDTPLVVYCATGARSGDASRVLSQMGFDVFDLTAGLVAWDGDLTTDPTPVQDTGPAQTSGTPVMYEFSTDT